MQGYMKQFIFKYLQSECPVCGNPEFNRDHLKITTFKARQITWEMHRAVNPKTNKYCFYYIGKIGKLGIFEVMPDETGNVYIPKYNGQIIPRSKRLLDRNDAKLFCQEYLSQILFDALDPEILKNR